MLKKVLKTIGILLLVVIVVVGGYMAYLFIDYHRLPDMDAEVEPVGELARTGEIYSLVSWNLGFGAYSADFGFFMDGGTESRARSKEAVYENLDHAVEKLKALDPDFMFLQELDTDATRSYHVNEEEHVRDSLEGYDSYFAQNYDSGYLFYPLLRPHGAAKAGLLTLFNTAASRFMRVSLPVETGIMKFFDLDRCYSKSYLPLEDGGTLVLYNLHLSAYTSDGKIATEQLGLLAQDMLEEYTQNGSYVIAGGDFNKDLLGNSPEVFGVSGDNYTWAQPIEVDMIPEGLSLVNSLDIENPIPSCRNADGLYVPGESFVLTVDGFIVSDNVRVLDCRVIDDGFACSDHNPVKLEFELEGE